MKSIVATCLLAFALSAQGGGLAHAEPATSQGGLDRNDPSMNGVKASTYTGRFYARTGAQGERLRRCIIFRESRGHYWSVNSSSHRGAYQFSPRFAHGLPYIVVRALKADGMGAQQAKRLRMHLSRTPIQQWSRRMQDTAFFAVLNYSSPFSGADHWFLKNSRCNALVGG